MTKKTIAIGDIHGLDKWKAIAERHRGDRIVFLGDYCDPYDEVSREVLLDNLLDIIRLKEERGEDVVLLLGNHDMHYIDDDFPTGTRYDEDMAEELREMFSEKRDLFQWAYQEGSTLFTHAGITDKWFTQDFKGDRSRNIAEQINNADAEQVEALYQVGRVRGGYFWNPGIFWADRIETEFRPLKGYRQVVGHSKVPNVITEVIDDTTSITYCDCLSEGGEYWIDG